MPQDNKQTIGENKPTDESKAVLDSMVDDVLGSPTEEKTKKLAKKVEEVEEEEEAPKEGLEEKNEDDETPEDEPKDKEEEIDEVIPASKAKKIQEKMQKRIDDLTRKLSEKEEAAQKKGATQEDKLEGLSIKQLNELKENVDESILDLKVSAKVDGVDVSEKLNEYRELKRNIDSTVKNAPNKFRSKQIDNLNSVIDDVKEIDADVVSHKGKLWETATTIFSKMPSLARSETGMAEAMAMAAEYILSNNSVSSGREKFKTLNQTVTKLKQKTSLESKNKSVDSSSESFKKLRSRAINGTLDDKVDFVASLIPEDFLTN